MLIFVIKFADQYNLEVGRNDMMLRGFVPIYWIYIAMSQHYLMTRFILAMKYITYRMLTR